MVWMSKYKDRVFIVLNWEEEEDYTLAKAYNLPENLLGKEIIIVDETVGEVDASVVKDGSIVGVFRRGKPAERCVCNKSGTLVKKGNKYYIRGAVLKDEEDYFELVKGRVSLSAMRPFSYAIPVRDIDDDFDWLDHELIITDGRTNIPEILFDIYGEIVGAPALIAVNGKVYLRELSSGLVDIDFEVRGEEAIPVRVARAPLFGSFLKLGVVKVVEYAFVERNFYADFTKGIVYQTDLLSRADGIYRLERG